MGNVEMTYERACEIVEACTANGVYQMLGATNGEPVPSLAEFTLAEMVEAQRVVRQTENDRQKADGLPRSFHVVCDDRLVAALYVAQNYPACSPDAAESVCLLPDGRAVFILDLSAELAARGREEDAAKPLELVR